MTLGQNPTPVVLTDLDGTLLEPDGQILPEVLDFLLTLKEAGVTVCPVTSKTPAELAYLLDRWGLALAAGFENGAGVRLANGQLELQPKAVPVTRLEEILTLLREKTGLFVRSVSDLEDHELAAITGLPAEQIPATRKRLASLPLVVEPRWDVLLQAALPQDPPVRLLRGNRFLHLQGPHGKAEVVPQLLKLMGHPCGPVVACGDSPNDEELLAAATVQVIVPASQGPHPGLCQRFPSALIPGEPHGRGWVEALKRVFSELLP
ncbi:Glucosyl-3-phosphoglycerate/mannosyl-3-phosphoglycerate phosphatase [bacterium HR09]|nr:Glucosyl-3-phosphoglycerate/mannosyl-3-phosphoglycerate phosphatase [bacterium HR09]